MDASSIINIAASGRAEEILAIVSEQIYVCSYVQEKECLYLRSQDGLSVELIELPAWIETGMIQECDLGDDEEEQFLEYAAQVDDGEAMSLAIAAARGFTLVTDDRKAQRLAQSGGITLLTTPQILRGWASTQTDATVSEALKAIETRARFRPRDEDPLNAWWLHVRDP
ncbi:MAG TPA: hypothetical protein VKL40_06390 [Candidatus Angelobacter sp.]|nr:hypothetical protein [Candidatus Angelobacter sp.]